MQRQRTVTLWQRLRHQLAESSEGLAVLTFIIVFVIFALFANNFLTALSISNIVTYASINGIIAIGVAILMIAGEFDLSVGSVLAVSSYVFALSLSENVNLNPVLAVFFALLVSTLLGLINGLVVVYGKIPSFIVTLGTLLAYRGLARFIGGGDFAYFDQDDPSKTWMLNFLNGSVSWLNELFRPEANFRVSSLWFIAILILMTVVMIRMPFGGKVFAVGGNSGAALAQGINVKRIKLLCFMLCSFFAGLAGVIQIAQRASVDPLRGLGLELIAVSAAVIGGVKLTGGYGTVIGAAFGMLLLSMLQQGLVLMGVPLEFFQAIAGVIIITAVVAYTRLQRL
jgi:simple sugar transport system permease protein